MTSPDWGLFPENLNLYEPDMYWGARAILSRHGLDIPWDRQSFQIKEGRAVSDSVKSEFIGWINSHVIPYIDKCVKEGKTKSLEGNNRNHRFHFVADDRESGGYLYIGAYAYVTVT